MDDLISTLICMAILAVPTLIVTAILWGLQKIFRKKDETKTSIDGETIEKSRELDAQYQESKTRIPIDGKTIVKRQNGSLVIQFDWSRNCLYLAAIGVSLVFCFMVFIWPFGLAHNLDVSKMGVSGWLSFAFVAILVALTGGTIIRAIATPPITLDMNNGLEIRKLIETQRTPIADIAGVYFEDMPSVSVAQKNICLLLKSGQAIQLGTLSGPSADVEL